MKYEMPSGLVISRIEHALLVSSGGGTASHAVRAHTHTNSYIFKNWATLCCFQINHHSFLSHKKRAAIYQLMLKHYKIKKNHQIWFSVTFAWQIFFLSFHRHVTASTLKIHQQQEQPPDKTFPFPLMAFVFDHVTRLGLGAISPSGPSGNCLSQKGCTLGGRRGAEPLPSSHTFTSKGNSGRGLPSRQGCLMP